jgi:2-polyprenyl-3-methyl-5-hydroxy-6-metoxy-1,4-benzoquinol methylase
MPKTLFFATMNGFINYKHCPVCTSTLIKEVMEVKDYTVSQQMFTIWECSHCTLRFTNDVPNAEAIGPFYHSAAYISHSNTKKGFINQLYHAVRNITLGTKKKLVQKYAGSRGRLLDVGAGIGAFSKKMQDAEWVVTGIEPDSIARENAQNLHGLTLHKAEELFDLTDRSFEAITLWHVLEHVHLLHNYMQQFAKILQPNGCLFIAVPNYTSKDAVHYGSYWAAWDVPRHLYHFSPKSMKALAEKHGFKVTAHKPMWFDSFYVSMLSEHYKTGHYNYWKAFFYGLWSNLNALLNIQHCSSVIYILQKK